MPQRFIEFKTEAGFDQWHAKAKSAHRIPADGSGRIGTRASDGVPQPNKQRTYAVVLPTKHASDPAEERVLALQSTRRPLPDLEVGKTIIDEVEAKARGYVAEYDADDELIVRLDTKPDSGAR